MRTTVGLYCALIVFLTACGAEQSESATGGDNTAKEHGSVVSNVPVSAPATTPSGSPSTIIPLNLKDLASIGQAGGGAVNPEHGKPGHRCDLAVGAPLNGGAPTAQPVAVPVSQPQVTIPAAATAPAALNAGGKTSAAGLNPEHGKPGHRCDIPVGAPLNSKPGQAQPQVVSTPAPATPVKTGMNPQHGQPGHRCDIAVGAPLDSKPTSATPAKPAEAKVSTDTSGK